MLVVLVGAAATATDAAAFGGAHRPVASTVSDDTRAWTWPLAGFRLDEPYSAPAHDYAPGHRGIDLRPLGGPQVMAPAGGIVAFSGAVAGRGILTIDHGDGLVTTFEPIESELRAGDAVARGDEVGVVALGGHSAPGALHFGVRRDGEYINPLLLLGGVPRAVLLPCC
ncbi:hypothetical protein GCM10009775_02730 [Microbacterium aoyamense]|uniref:M23ase beta-sheet core domain-containing protein n=2 Tax=Microbacterium aoyamense TaxID=344166 RepID=A0ABN2P7R0_9MICO